MLFDLLILGGLLFSAAVIYLAVEKMLSLSPRIIDKMPQQEYGRYNIASEDIMFLRELERFTDLSVCTCYTGNRREILSEISPRTMDLIVFSEADPDSCPYFEGMRRMHAQYYCSSVSLQGISLRLHPLNHRPRHIVICYRPVFESALMSMVSQGVLTECANSNEVKNAGFFHTIHTD